MSYCILIVLIIKITYINSRKLGNAQTTYTYICMCVCIDTYICIFAYITHRSPINLKYCSNLSQFFIIYVWAQMCTHKYKHTEKIERVMVLWPYKCHCSHRQGNLSLTCAFNTTYYL